MFIQLACLLALAMAPVDDGVDIDGQPVACEENHAREEEPPQELPVESDEELRASPEEVSNEIGEQPVDGDEKQMPEVEEAQTLPWFKAIVLCDHCNHTGLEQLEGVHVVGVEVRGTRLAWRRFHRDLGSRYLNQPLTFDQLEQMKQDIVIYYTQAGCPFVRVMIPEQDVTDCVLRILVVESCLEEVSVKGNCWNKGWVLKGGIFSKVGEPIDMDVVNADLAYLNRNPFRQSNALFTPGNEPGTTKMELVTKEKRPGRIYAGLDDRGNDAIGIMRQFYGVNYGNFMGIGHVLSYQLTASFDFHDMIAHAGYYEIPIPYRQSLVFFGGYSRIRDGDVGDDVRSEGNNIQVSARYHLPLFATGRMFHDFSVGFDFKETNNNALFSEEPVFVNLVNLSQFVMSYQYQLGWEWATFVGNVDCYFSPARFFTKQSASDFNQLAPGARPKYYYWHTNMAARFFLPKNFGIFTKFWGQIANQNLLPSEQIGLGGFDTVRGYREREINGDNGVFVSSEFLMPPFSMLKRRGKGVDEMTFLAFVDYGWTTPHRQITDEIGTPLREEAQTIWGIGPGARYTIGENVNFTAYWGKRLKTTENDKSHGGRVNFSLTVSY